MESLDDLTAESQHCPVTLTCFCLASQIGGSSVSVIIKYHPQNKIIDRALLQKPAATRLPVSALPASSPSIGSPLSVLSADSAHWFSWSPTCNMAHMFLAESLGTTL